MSATIIREHHGIVDHFLGDAIMALFNVPIKHDDHVLRAVTAARRIREGMDHMNSKLDDVVHLAVGIGIATGAALATNMGSTNCSDYTMVGNAINIASRLQGKAATGEILGGILILEASDLNHAIQLMSQHPGLKVGPREIRPVEIG